MTVQGIIDLHLKHPERFAGQSNVAPSVFAERAFDSQRVAGGSGRPLKVHLVYKIGDHISATRAAYLKNKLMPSMVSVLQQYVKVSPLHRRD